MFRPPKSKKKLESHKKSQINPKPGLILLCFVLLIVSFFMLVVSWTRRVFSEKRFVIPFSQGESPPPRRIWTRSPFLKKKHVWFKKTKTRNFCVFTRPSLMRSNWNVWEIGRLRIFLLQSYKKLRRSSPWSRGEFLRKYFQTVGNNWNCIVVQSNNMPICPFISQTK